MSKTLKPLKKQPNLYLTVQAAVKSYIIDNNLQPGAALPPETELARQLGVGRNSVREAVKALESLGVLETRRGTGVFVREFNFDSMTDLLSYGLLFDQRRIGEICQIRKWLETAAIGKVIEQITDQDIAHIEAVFERWQQKIATHASTADEDREFHRLLFAVLGNQSLIALIDIFWVVFHNVTLRTITTDRRPTTTIQDHRNILAAVKKRDSARARQCIEQHFRNLEERIARVYG